MTNLNFYDVNLFQQNTNRQSLHDSSPSTPDMSPSFSSESPTVSQNSVASLHPQECTDSFVPDAHSIAPSDVNDLNTIMDSPEMQLDAQSDVIDHTSLLELILENIEVNDVIFHSE